MHLLIPTVSNWAHCVSRSIVSPLCAHWCPFLKTTTITYRCYLCYCYRSQLRPHLVPKLSKLNRGRLISLTPQNAPLSPGDELFAASGSFRFASSALEKKTGPSGYITLDHFGLTSVRKRRHTQVLGGFPDNAPFHLHMQQISDKYGH
jgi:hypothetical protein